MSADEFDQLTAEAMALYADARAVFAVDADDPEKAATFAEVWGESLRAAGHGVTIADAGRSPNADGLRARLIGPHRQAAAPAGVLIVHGVGLTAPGLIGLWNFTVRLTDLDTAARDRQVLTGVSALFDTDSETPHRLHLDFC